jgi:hypothetical protein
MSELHVGGALGAPFCALIVQLSAADAASYTCKGHNLPALLAAYISRLTSAFSNNRLTRCTVPQLSFSDLFVGTTFDACVPAGDPQSGSR